MKVSEFEEWINDPTTKEVLAIVAKERAMYERPLVEGVYAKEKSMEDVAGKYIWTTAYLTGLNFIVNDLVNYLEEDEKDDAER